MWALPRGLAGRERGSAVKSSNYWIAAVIGLVILVVGVLIRGAHNRIGLACIVIGVVVAVVGIVMALMSGGRGKAA